MSGPSYFVKDGHTLGYIEEATPLMFWPLAATVDGHDWKNGPVSAFHADLRPATHDDFEIFRVDSKGHIA